VIQGRSGCPSSERWARPLSSGPSSPSVLTAVILPAGPQPFSLIRFTTSDIARQVVASHNSSLASTVSLAGSKPLFLELARPQVALSVLATPPDQYEQEGAIEFEPGKRRWPCNVEVWNDFISVEEEQMLIAKMRELGEWEDGAEKRLSVSRSLCQRANSMLMTFVLSRSITAHTLTTPRTRQRRRSAPCRRTWHASSPLFRTRSRGILSIR
jgi:hypothetical protein